MSPALNGSSAVRHFEHSNAIEIRDGKTFNFYAGLPQLCTCKQLYGLDPRPPPSTLQEERGVWGRDGGSGYEMEGLGTRRRGLGTRRRVWVRDGGSGYEAEGSGYEAEGSGYETNGYSVLNNA